MSFDIRLMSRADLDVALGWAREEGWNPGLDDAGAFYAQDPTGFFMGWLDDEPIACISVVKYGDVFAFLGLYIVRPAWRGRGYGKAIWDAGIASAENRTIGLDGVVAQQDNYRRSGFVLAHRSARWGGVPRTTGGASLARPIADRDVPGIAALDRRCFPERRDTFLDEWLHASPTRRSYCIEHGGRIIAFGSIRQSVDGYKIGPLFSETPDAASSLLETLVASAGPASVCLDIPAYNTAAIHLAQSLGLTPSFETARMYRGPAPPVARPLIFGITTLELG
jgi:GNAT superfamily N-acetyltransferase